MSPVASRRSQLTATTTATTINGPRPPTLKLNPNSHIIHKPPNAPLPVHHQHHRRGERSRPVIVYIRSPKVVHTKPRDFMALVQELTGLSSDQMARDLPSNNQQDGHSHGSSAIDASSGDGINGACDDNVHTSSFLDKFDPPGTRLRDIPLYTPTGIDIFLS